MDGKRRTTGDTEMRRANTAHADREVVDDWVEVRHDELADELADMGVMSNLKQNKALYTVVVIAAVLALSLVFAIPLANHFGSPETYSGIIASLDKKAENVTALTAASATASGLITLVPGDGGSTIAEKLADISVDFAVVLAAIYLEKYLLTIFGMASFRILFPAGFVTLAGVFLTRQDSRWRHVWGQLAFKFLVFALAAAVVVPASVMVSDLVEQTYQDDIDAAKSVVSTSEATAGSTATDQGSAANGSADGTESTDDSEQDSTGDHGNGVLDWLQNAGSAISDAATDATNAVSSGTSELVESGKEALNRMVEALVVAIVTDCVIPILVFIFFVWLCKMILGIDVDLGAGVSAAKAGAHKAQAGLSKRRLAGE